jgi:hypothetical protein
MVVLSAPPMAAAALATVVLSMFTQGSRFDIMMSAVRAWRFIARCGSLAPQASATRDQSLRAARSLAMALKKSHATGMTKTICLQAASMSRPAALIAFR